jgi:predicted nucleotidyltransferase
VEKSAVHLTPEEIAVYRAGWAKRAQQKQVIQQDRLDQAWKVARKGATMLRREFGVDKVWVFGSLLYPERFDNHSDIDLAVESIEGTDFYRAVSWLLDIDFDFSFDLVELAHASERMRSIIAVEGQEL